MPPLCHKYGRFTSYIIYGNALTLHIPKAEEAKPKQIKVNVVTPAIAAKAKAA
jgi:hypothetical protein